MDGFHLSELEVQKVVLVCYVAVVCHKLRSVLLEIALISSVNAEAKWKGI